MTIPSMFKNTNMVTIMIIRNHVIPMVPDCPNNSSSFCQ